MAPQQEEFIAAVLLHLSGKMESGTASVRLSPLTKLFGAGPDFAFQWLAHVDGVRNSDTRSRKHCRGFATIITNEFYNAGFETLQLVKGERMYNTTDSQELPPINVTFEHPFLSAMVKITPSPDWFVGFSDFRTISPVTETYYKRIVIRRWVWDAGTDGGQTYTALDRDLDPQVPVSRLTRATVPPRGQFLDPLKTHIPIPAEFECVLRVGDGQIIVGVPFNESDLRPELFVPRADDFIDGLPATPESRNRRDKDRNNGNGNGNGNGRGGVVWSDGGTCVGGGVCWSIGGSHGRRGFAECSRSLTRCSL
jgi:hypothetical protein